MISGRAGTRFDFFHRTSCQAFWTSSKRAVEDVDDDVASIVLKEWTSLDVSDSATRRIFYNQRSEQSRMEDDSTH